MSVPNSARCLQCQTVIQSVHVHDFARCACRRIFIDGGDEYFRFGGDLQAFDVNWASELTQYVKNSLDRTAVDVQITEMHHIFAGSINELRSSLDDVPEEHHDSLVAAFQDMRVGQEVVVHNIRLTRIVNLQT